MIRRAVAACAAAMCLAAGVLAQGSERTILLTVLQKDGTPLRDMKPAEFTVREGGQVAEVTNAELASDPMTVAVLIDTSKPQMGTEFPTREIRNGLTSLIKAIYEANPQSKISLTDFAGAAVKTVDFTSDGDKMLKQVNRIYASQRGSGVLIEALVDTGKDLQKATTPRKAVVILSFDSPESSSTQPRDAAMAVQKSGAAVWAISVGTDTAPNRNVMLENLPALTGGERITMVSATGLEQAMAKLGAALTSQYQVTFKHIDGASADSIQAGAKRGDTVVRAPLMKDSKTVK